MALPNPDEATTALVTGASAGLGVELARSLARRGYGMTLVARRADRLEELAEELRAAHRVRVEAISCDLGDPEARDHLEASISELGLTVGILINNAGYGSGAPFIKLQRSSEAAMVRLNCEAVVDLCGRYVPAMVERGVGGICNVASVVAFQPVPRQATYSASKAMVKAFTEALHAELRSSGVHVSALCPGPMKTEFVDVAAMNEAVAGVPDFAFKAPSQVAEAGIRGLIENDRIVLPAILDKLSAGAGAHAPRGAVLRAIERFYPVGRPSSAADRV